MPNALAKHIDSQKTQTVLTALLSLLGGLAALTATWALSYLVSLTALGPWISYQHWLHSVGGIIVSILLFVAHARTTREYWSEYSVVPVSGENIVTFYLPGVGLASNINPLAPGTIHSMAKIITDCLLVGPRLMATAAKELRKASRLRRIDVAACAEVLTLLLATNHRMSFQEIVDQIEGLDPVTIFPQLQEIEGVIFLHAEPPGLAMTPELKKSLFD